MRMLDRDHIAMSDSLASHADDRGKRLSIRFAATVKDTLGTRRGMGGHTDSACERARNVDPVQSKVLCYDKILKTFCTFGYAAPGGDIVQGRARVPRGFVQPHHAGLEEVMIY